LRNVWLWAIHPLCALLKEMCGKRRDVFSAITQRRDFDRKNPQTIE
jgi:hypothetical protein